MVRNWFTYVLTGLLTMQFIDFGARVDDVFV